MVRVRSVTALTRAMPLLPGAEPDGRMDMGRVFRKPKLLRTLTTLDPAEFERLPAAFEVAWQTRRQGHNYTGQVRQRRPGAGHPGTLESSRAKLFFLLFLPVTLRS